jgi:hypothetical protein
MKQLVLEYRAEIALGTLRPSHRRRLQGLIDSLRNWHTDRAIRERSEPIALRNVYRLPSSKMYIFFKLGADKITVLDIANKDLVDQFAGAE